MKNWAMTLINPYELSLRDTIPLFTLFSIFCFNPFIYSPPFLICDAHQIDNQPRA